MEAYCPDVIDTYREMAQTGCCEFVGETYYHSLAGLYNREEFTDQVDMHTRKIQNLFGVTPTVFRNTELIYSNDLAWYVSQMKDPAGNGRFYGMITEGTDFHLGYRAPTFVYHPPGKPIGRDGRPFGTLLKNYRLSDDIAFRFSNRGWAEWPLTAEKFAKWANLVNGNGYLVNLFMDYETFGEHQWADTGIFEFLAALPQMWFDVNPGQNHFITPSMALTEFSPVGEYDVHNYISWADTERDLTAWRGNAMQHNALEETYRLGHEIRESWKAAAKHGPDERRTTAGHLLADWRKLTTSDHFYYMCTKYFADGDVHKYFNPYDSPYDSYINFMNVLDNLRTRLARL
jgi:alpha-amylase